MTIRLGYSDPLPLFMTIRLGYSAPPKRRVAADSETSPYGCVASSMAKSRVVVSEAFFGTVDVAKQAIAGSLARETPGGTKDDL